MKSGITKIGWIGLSLVIAILLCFQALRIKDRFAKFCHKHNVQATVDKDSIALTVDFGTFTQNSAEVDHRHHMGDSLLKEWLDEKAESLEAERLRKL